MDEEISIGDYVLTGGEVPAMAIIDSVSRLVPGVLHNTDSAPTDSFENNLLEFPQYTKPYDFMGMKVPDILLSVVDWVLNISAIPRTRQGVLLHRSYTHQQ